MTHTDTILLICQPECAIAALAQECARVGLNLLAFHDIQDALRWCTPVPVHLRGVLVCDDPRRTRLEWIAQLPDVPVVGLVRQGDVARAVVAMQSGAQAVLEMPQLLEMPAHHSVLTALDLAEISEAKEEQEAFVCATNSPLGALLDLIPQVARAESPVVVHGPKGVGKGRLARQIHALSTKHDAPLHEHQARELETMIKLKKALTDARGGTLLIRSIEVWPRTFCEAFILEAATQTQLVRLVLTTSGSLEFTQSMNAHPDLEPPLVLTIPGLAERPQDIGPLCAHVTKRYQAGLEASKQGEVAGITREVISMLKGYRWPGNVRELEETVMGMWQRKQRGFLEREDVPAHIHQAPPVPLNDLSMPSEGIDMTQTLDDLERDLLARALRKSQGNKSQAARLLGINRTTLVEKLKRKQMEFDAQGKEKTA